MAIPILLFVIALAVRVVVAAFFVEPAYPDALYYANLGRELATGGGFSVDYIWNFVEVGGTLPAEGELPIPSNAHWMPLAAVIQLPSIWLLGPTATASALPFWLLAAATSPLTWFIGRDAGISAAGSASAALLVALPAAVSPFLGQPDNFAPYMFLGALALWLCGRGLRGYRWSFAAGGVVVGLAFLSRNDGVLLGVPFALAFLYDLLRTPRLSRIGWGSALACAGLALLTVAPWLLRQLMVFGSISPSSAGGRILFISEYRELYSVTSDTSLGAFLDQGLGAILDSRVQGLLDALLIFAAMPLMGLLVPLLLIGAWVSRRSRDFAPWFIYAITLFLFTAVVSAVHVPFGTFIHSAVALLPHAYLLVFVGVAAVVGWIAARRPHWNAEKATRNMGFMLVGVIAVVSVLATRNTLEAWTEERDGRAEVLAALAEQAHPDDVVMSSDAGAYQYHGDWAGIVTPDDPLATVEQALRRYDVRWLALEGAHTVESLQPVIRGEEQPEWLSEPLVVTPALPLTEDELAELDGEEPAPRAALFAVCLTPDDERCQP